jgi:predicted DNA-binding transcriptional regulator YafY
MARSDRRQRLLALLADDPGTTAHLARRLRCTPRTVQLLLADLRISHPDRLIPLREGRSVRWTWRGDIPVPLPTPIDDCTVQELLALATARGLLGQPGPDPGTLAAALDRLIDRSGLRPEIRHLTPDTIEVAHHARVAEPPGHLPLLAEAIRSREPVRFTYTNLDGQGRPVHAMPARLRLIAAEWHVVAWERSPRRGGGLWTYRLSRIRDLARTTILPDGWRPPTRTDLDHHGRGAFGATSGQPMTTVVLGIAPRLHPHIVDRIWGLGQRLTAAPDLGPGWHRLRFATTGLDEARHKILSWGALVRVEAPDTLKSWIREQAHGILAAMDDSPNR